MEKEYLSLGLIGLGDHGTEKILPALAQSSFGKIVATCDTVLPRAAYGYQNYGANNCYQDFKAMIDSEHLDAVVVAVSPQVHFEVARLAMERGIAVFVEKSPALHLEQLEELVQISEETGMISGVGLNFRYSTPIKIINDILLASDDRPVWTAIKHTSSKPRSKYAWPVSYERTFLLEQVIHPLDTLIYFNGPIIETSVIHHKGRFGIQASCNFRFANGAIGNLVSGTTSPYFNNYLELETSEGKVFKLDHLWDLSFVDQSHPLDMPDQKRWGLYWRPSPTDSGYKRSGYANELEEFLRCVKNHNRFSPSFKDVIHHYHLLDEIELQISA